MTGGGMPSALDARFWSQLHTVQACRITEPRTPRPPLGALGKVDGLTGKIAIDATGIYRLSDD
jgi:hypothetical protein